MPHRYVIQFFFPLKKKKNLCTYGKIYTNEEAEEANSGVQVQWNLVINKEFGYDKPSL